MEKDGCNVKGQLPLPFKCKKMVADGGKANESNLGKAQATKIDEKKDNATYLALETPIKKPIPPRSTINDNFLSVKEERRNSPDSMSASCSITEVAEKYFVISKFFDEMECSTRLLNLRKKPSTFCNISSQVEVLTRRKFLYHHLAQIKYIFPEAIHVEKILTHDERTSCMVPDMKITILSNAIETYGTISASTSLRQAFRARLFNFVNTNQEDIDIPEAALPEPFYCQSRSGSQIPLSAGTSISITSRLICSGEEKDGSCISQGAHSCKSTPVKPVDTPSRLMVMTPELQMPKISNVGSPLEEVDSQVKISMPSVRKSLTFSPAKTPVDSFSLSKRGSSVCYSAHQMAENRSIAEQELNRSYTATKEMGENDASGILEYQDTSEEALKKKTPLLASLPDLFNSVRCIFQSIKSYSITKQELVHKILSHNYELEDAEEVEEQLKLLENLVPDWICQKTASSGDLIYCIQKAYDLEAIRARLIEAI